MEEEHGDGVDKGGEWETWGWETWGWEHRNGKQVRGTYQWGKGNMGNIGVGVGVGVGMARMGKGNMRMGVKNV